MKAAAVLLICVSVALGEQQALKGLLGRRNKKDYYEEAQKNVKFELSTRDNLEEMDTVSLAEKDMKHFKASRPTKILLHGWNSKRALMYEMAEAFLSEMDVNVLMVNWSDVDSLNYFGTTSKLHGIARRLADLINHLRESLGVQPEDLHLVGHSLGAHIAGLSSLYLTQGTLGRITGLDPAGPNIIDSPTERLDKSQARFVDVIHTAGNLEGWRDPLGHVDFYPNGGKSIQPGCLLLEVTTFKCSHDRAYHLFIESVTLKNSFMALPSKAFKAGSWPCKKVDKKGEKLVMGLDTPESARGVYCLETRGSSPYGYGDKKH